MPHVVLEYSDNLIPHFSIETLLPALHKKLTAFESIPLSDTKTRALPYAYYEVGEKGHQGAFMHLTILMMSGRPQALRTQIGEALLAVMKSHVAKIPTQLSCGISIEIREMERSDYFKTSVNEVPSK